MGRWRMVGRLVLVMTERDRRIRYWMSLTRVLAFRARLAMDWD